MNLFDAINQLITERGSAAVLDKHLAFIKDQVQALAQEKEELQKENSKLKAENANLRQQIKSQAGTDEFVEYKGALFKRKPEGGYTESAYCPRCKYPMAATSSRFPFQCIPCKHIAQFKHGQLPMVIAELPENTAG